MQSYPEVEGGRRGVARRMAPDLEIFPRWNSVSLHLGEFA